MKHAGSLPHIIFVVSCPNEGLFWIYLKEGHAINRMLKEQKNGRTASITQFAPNEVTHSS